MRRQCWLVAVLVVAGCSKAAPPQKPEAPAAPTLLSGDIRIALGDCAAPATSFVSGPRPQPLADALAPTSGEPDGEFASLTGTGDISSGFDDTIGTGRDRTIGHGAGTGMPARRSDVPTLRLGMPTGRGDLDKAIIRRYIKRNVQKLLYCYEKNLLAKPTLAGTVTATFTISKKGTVEKASAAGVDADVSACIATVIRGIEFPKPRDGGTVDVSYPITFRPGTATAATPPPPARDDEEDTAGSGTAMALEEGRMGRTESERAARAIDPSYVPGASSPLAAIEGDLVDCFRRQRDAYGIAVVDVAPGSLAATGIADPGFTSCVRGLASKVTVSEPTRCSVAFGRMPVSAAPGVDITARAIRFGGKKVADPSDSTMRDEPAKLDRLYERATDRLRALPTAAVTLHGPVVVRPVDATPMKVVTDVLYTLRAADDDFVLAARRDGKWALLRPIELPVVPVPVSSGARWESAGRIAMSDVPADERVHLAVLVTTDRIWLGLSRVNEFQAIERGDTASLASALRAHKASAFFADRTDIEIAGEDTVAYGDVVKVVDAAAAAGFTEWRVMSHLALSARPQL